MMHAASCVTLSDAGWIDNDALGVKLVNGRFVCGSHQGDKVERS